MDLGYVMHIACLVNYSVRLLVFFLHFLRQFMNMLTITLVLPPVVIQNSLEKMSCDIREKSKLHCSNEEYWNMKVCILL